MEEVNQSQPNQQPIEQQPTIQQPVNPVQNSLPPQEKKSNHLMTYIIIGAVLLILIIAAFLFIPGSNNEEEQENDNSEPPIVTDPDEIQDPPETDDPPQNNQEVPLAFQNDFSVSEEFFSFNEYPNEIEYTSENYVLANEKVADRYLSIHRDPFLNADIKVFTSEEAAIDSHAVDPASIGQVEGRTVITPGNFGEYADQTYWYMVEISVPGTVYNSLRSRIGSTTIRLQCIEPCDKASVERFMLRLLEELDQ